MNKSTTPSTAAAQASRRRPVTARPDPDARDAAAGTEEGGAGDFSGVPLLATAATTSFGLGVVRCTLSQRKASLW